MGTKKGIIFVVVHRFGVLFCIENIHRKAR